MCGSKSFFTPLYNLHLTLDLAGVSVNRHTSGITYHGLKEPSRGVRAVGSARTWSFDYRLGQRTQSSWTNPLVSILGQNQLTETKVLTYVLD